MAIYKPGNRSSPDVESARALILDFPASTMVRNKFQFVSHPVYSTLLQQPEQNKTVAPLLIPPANTHTYTLPTKEKISFHMMLAVISVFMIGKNLRKLEKLTIAALQQQLLSMFYSLILCLQKPGAPRETGLLSPGLFSFAVKPVCPHWTRFVKGSKDTLSVQQTPHCLSLDESLCAGQVKSLKNL